MKREEGYELIFRKKKSQEEVAKLLGISRQRVGHLYRKWKENKMSQPKPTGKTVRADHLAPASGQINCNPGADPLDGAEAPAAPPAPPGDISDILRPVGDVPDQPTSPPPVVVVGVEAKPFDPPPDTSDIERIDPEDASAGRELVTYGTRLLREYAARRLRVKEEEAVKENEFLRVAMKRNSEKFHLLGWLTKGWKGLVIGGILDVIRMALLAPVTSAATQRREPEAGTAPAAAEPTEPDEPTPIGEEAEPAAPKRPTLSEKIERMGR